VETTTFEGERDFIRNKIVPVHHKPQPPTLIVATHVPIIMHMGMMSIIISHTIKSYSKASQGSGKGENGKVWPTRVNHETNSRPSQHHGG
jgi:hypothetical protein